MKKEEIQKRVCEVVGFLTKTDPKTIKRNSNFYGDLGVDSLDFMEIVLELEKNFGVEIPEKMSEINNVGDMVDKIFELTNSDAVLHQEEKENDK